MNNQRGFITLEATLVIPVFLTMIIGLIILIRIALVQIALQNAADETVKQLAVFMYPLESSMQKTVSTKDQWLNTLLDFVPDPIKPTIKTIVNEQLDVSLTQPIMKSLFKPIYWHYMDNSSKSRIIHYDQLHIDLVSIPFINNEDEVLGIEVQYEFHLKLPYYQKTIVIRKRAYERVWSGA